MDKIVEALSKLLPEDQVKEVADAVKAMLEETKVELEKEANEKLEAAYAELANELETAKKTTEEGYQEAFTIITDLKNRLEAQKVEFEQAMDEGYEEAYQMIKSEKEKNSNIEVEMYEEFDNKLAQMKEYIVDKLDEFLKQKGTEIYENARRDVLNDPRMAGHKVTLEKVVDTVANYLSDEDMALATSSKLEEAHKSVEELKGQVRILEARNIRLSTENNKLNEAVRHKEEVLTESKKVAEKAEKKERVEKAQKAEGRGTIVTEGIIGEPVADPTPTANATDDEMLKEWQHLAVLAGVKKSE